MARLILLFLATIVATSGGAARAAQTEAKSDVAGVYRCEGMNPDGSGYQGLVEIAAVEDTYLIRWTLAGNEEVIGVGIFKDGVLAVSYFGGTPAVVMYKLDGERLIGHWTMGGTEGMVYSETLTRVKPGESPPSPAPAPDERRPVRQHREV